MGHVLAKLPQQRIRAGEKHPTVLKLEKLFDFMDELGLELALYRDRVYVVDKDRPQDKDWEIRDAVNSEFLNELPCNVGQYKITQDVDVSPREAQPAPKQQVKKTGNKKSMVFKPVQKKNLTVAI